MANLDQLDAELKALLALQELFEKQDVPTDRRVIWPEPTEAAMINRIWGRTDG